MFHFMLLVWADTHVDEHYDHAQFPHPLEGTLTDDVLGQLVPYFNEKKIYFLNY